MVSKKTLETLPVTLLSITETVALLFSYQKSYSLILVYVLLAKISKIMSLRIENVLKDNCLFLKFISIFPVRCKKGGKLRERSFNIDRCETKEMMV